MPHALIQLVSEQTLPNILPALVLRPSLIILCPTRRTERQTHYIRRALELAGLTFDLRILPLTENPEIQETGAAIRQAIQDCANAGLTPVVNFTCGTKLMGLGAFVAALNTKSASLYIDSEQYRFIDGNTGPLPALIADSFAALRTAESALTLEIMAAAHGIESLSAGRDPAPYLTLARHLHQNPEEENRLNQAVKAIGNPRKPAELLQALTKPLAGLSPTTANLAIEAGLLTAPADSPRLTRPASLAKLEAWADGERYTIPEWIAALEPFQEIQNFLGGGWWEIAVYEAAQRSGHFRDLRWSVKVHSVGQTFEKDLLAIEGLNLAVFSCKRGGEKGRLVGALEELDSTARQLGGSHAKRYFAVAQPVPKAVFAAVQERAQQTRTTLLGPATRLTPDSFR